MRSTRSQVLLPALAATAVVALLTVASASARTDAGTKQQAATTTIRFGRR